jgi:hypothetical protein
LRVWINRHDAIISSFSVQLGNGGPEQGKESGTLSDSVLISVTSPFIERSAAAVEASPVSSGMGLSVFNLHSKRLCMSSQSILGLHRERLPVLLRPFMLPMLGMDSRTRENGDAPRVGVPKAGEPDVERSERNKGESR